MIGRSGEAISIGSEEASKRLILNTDSDIIVIRVGQWQSSADPMRITQAVGNVFQVDMDPVLINKRVDELIADNCQRKLATNNLAPSLFITLIIAVSLALIAFTHY